MGRVILRLFWLVASCLPDLQAFGTDNVDPADFETKLGGSQERKGASACWESSRGF